MTKRTRSPKTRKVRARTRQQPVARSPRRSRVVAGLFVACALSAGIIYFLPREAPVSQNAGERGGVPGGAPGHISPAANAEHDVADALASAATDGKPVLLDFGADWCLDCTVLTTLFRDPSVEPFLQSHFHVVAIDLGEYFNGPGAERNPAIAARYRCGPEPDRSAGARAAHARRHDRANQRRQMEPCENIYA